MDKNNLIFFDGFLFILGSKISTTKLNKLYFWSTKDGRIIKFGFERPARIICEKFLKDLDKPLRKDYIKSYENQIRIL